MQNLWRCRCCRVVDLKLPNVMKKKNLTFCLQRGSFEEASGAMKEQNTKMLETEN